MTDTVASAAPQVCDDMTVEVALAVMAGARTDHLRVCDSDDRCTGLVTGTQLSTIRDSADYTDRLRLRDLSARVPSASPRAPGGAAVPPLMGGQDHIRSTSAQVLVLA